MKVEIRNMNEKLETLMKQPPPVKEKSRVEGKTRFCGNVTWQMLMWYNVPCVPVND